MKDQKEHIDIDLEFLDKKEPVRVAPKKPEPSEGNGPNWRIYNPNNANSKAGNIRKYNWKNILIIGGVVLFFGWVIFSGSSDSTSNSYAPTSNGTQLFSEGGQTFSCTNSNYNRALQLKPNSSTNAQLASELDSLNARIDANKADKTQLDAMYVDESDQYAIDNYNSRVDAYNAERDSLISGVTNWKKRHDAFSSQVDTYNNFLDTNCTQ